MLPAGGCGSLLLIFGLLTISIFGVASDGVEPTAAPTIVPLAPDFTVAVFDHAPLDYSGEQLSLAELRGSVVVLNFWASYCGPCRDEAVMLEMLYREHQSEGVVFLGINTDDIKNNALDFLNEYGITYPNAPDVGSAVESDYRITGIPETFVIDQTGIVVRHFARPVTETQLRAEIEQLLVN